MSVKKAEEFLKYLAKNKDLQKKMSGFTAEEFKTAKKQFEKKRELSKEELSNVAGGYVCGPFVGS